MKLYNPWPLDQKNSIAAIHKNKRYIIDALGGGEIYPIEGINIKILQILDMVCGIDYIWVRDKKVRGIASRVQWGHNYDTFTIRYERKSGTETEYKKRLEAIKEKESFRPYLTMQMYCDNEKENELESLAIIKTEDLFEIIFTYPKLVHETKSNNFFKYILWDDIKNIENETNKEILIMRRIGLFIMHE
ncbi:hypothetical protein ES705_04968 [subsurface metagenome]